MNLLVPLGTKTVIGVKTNPVFTDELGKCRILPYCTYVLCMFVNEL